MGSTGDVLETPRLLLRRFTLDDLEPYFLLGSVPAVVRYVGNKPMKSLDDAREIMRKMPLRDYAVHGYGRLACVEKQTGKLIGACGLKFIEELSEVEVGYRFLPESWGKGYATESARAVIQHGREVLGFRRIIGLVDPENTASIAVLKKLGMRFEKKVRLDLLDGDEADLYALEA